ncbi:MAG: aspartate aminotransferase family protein [Saprospiraceae bacterium]
MSSNPDFRQRAHALVDLLADHLEAAERADGRSIPYQSPEESYSYWESFEGDEQSLYAAVLAQSTAVHHPGYVGHQVSVPSTEGILASWVSDVLNNGSAVYEMGMAANAIERRVSKEMASHFDLPTTATGIFTSGGSLANLTAMLAARAKKAPNAEGQSLCVLVSDQAHYCIDRAVRIMGWGPEGIVEVATNESFQVTAESLELGLLEASKSGRRPIAIVGMACSTSTGTYDNLQLISAFAKTHDLWFHVDAAHGGVAGFSESEKHKVLGIENADTITLDAHKMMRVPALTTLLLYRDEVASYRTFSQKADYLWDEAGPEWYHSGQRTVECTKLMMGLRVLAVTQGDGMDKLAKYVDDQYALARAFAKTLDARSSWEIATEPMSNIVCFRHIPAAISDVDSHNKAIRDKLLLDGRWYVVNTRLRGAYWLRVTLMNPSTSIEYLMEMVGFAETN